VWATEQDDASKRVVPSNPSHSDDENVATGTGQDALVPWVLTQSQPHNANDPATPQDNQNQVYQRYYHFFAPGELRELVCLAGRSLDLDVGVPPNPGHDPIPTSTRPCRRGMEIVNEGWERSNYYIEVKLWETGT
jgi:tRNA (uracil-5-)-methyltransferase TRM9